ncbi:MAG: carbon storage regulator CsrA [Proteobacteria bacterium]|nr:carbon storage regulator CsrA [Pseudomonadota bacterium]MBU1742771.1 carbon storage regulator CsrA [Pseudomonadota bacterium]
MLILTRKIGESIMVGDDVKVSVVEIKGRHVRLGIDAPQAMAIHRQEVFEKIQQANLAAAAANAQDLDQVAALLGAGRGNPPTDTEVR